MPIKTLVEKAEDGVALSALDSSSFSVILGSFIQAWVRTAGPACPELVSGSVVAGSLLALSLSNGSKECAFGGNLARRVSRQVGAPSSHAPHKTLPRQAN